MTVDEIHFMKAPKTYWVGVRKDRNEDHEVFHAAEEDVTPERYPNYDYTIGPFTHEADAKKRAAREKNCTGTFIDPFCNKGQGR